jgi:uncharacterized protein (UPF0332 family)
MNDAEITLIRYRMDRSKEALSAAGLMYEKGHYNDAVNRLYYFCFYAVIALLATEGIHPGKHTAARGFYTTLFLIDVKRETMVISFDLVETMWKIG